MLGAVGGEKHMIGRVRAGWMMAPLLLLLAGSATTPAQAAPSAFHLCQSGSAPQRLKACAALLQEPALPARQAALAHYFRGFAEHDLGQDEAALADFDSALSDDAEL